MVNLLGDTMVKGKCNSNKCTSGAENRVSLIYYGYPHCNVKNLNSKLSVNVSWYRLE